MAIDTPRKRMSVAAISLYPLGPVLVPDGSFAVADRQTIGYGYYGIIADVAIAETAGVVCIKSSSAATNPSYMSAPKATGYVRIPKATGYRSC